MKPHQVNEKFIDDVFENKCTIGYVSKICYKKPWIPDSVLFPIVNYRFIATQSFPLKILYDFLLDIKLKKYNKYFISMIEEDKKKAYKKVLVSDDIFVYGMDELFSNHVLLNYYKLTMSTAYIWLIPYLVELHKYFPSFVASNKMNFNEYNNIYSLGYDIFNNKKEINRMHKYLQELSLFSLKNNINQKYKDCIYLGSLFYKYIDYNDIFSKFVIPYNLFDTSDNNYLASILKYSKPQKFVNDILIFDYSDKSKYDSSFCDNITFIKLKPIDKNFDNFDINLLSKNSKTLFNIINTIYKYINLNLSYIKNSGLQENNINDLINFNKKSLNNKKYVIIPFHYSLTCGG